jgi:hypothetical protein
MRICIYNAQTLASFLLFTFILYCKTFILKYDEYQAVDLLRAQPQGAEKDTRHGPVPVGASHSVALAQATTLSVELLSRRERRKGKSSALAAGLPVPPPAPKTSAPLQLSTAQVHQQMAEMKRYVRTC